MKKQFALLLLLTITFVNSQNNFEVFTGINLSTFGDKGLSKIGDFKSTSFHLGIAYEFSINNKISFRPKLIYSQQGDRVKNSKSFYQGNLIVNRNFINGIDYKLDYINIPLNFKFFNKTYLIAGPQLGFLLSTKKIDLDFGDIDNKIDLGMNLGLG